MCIRPAIYGDDDAPLIANATAPTFGPALAQTVRHVNPRAAPAAAKPRHQCRRCRSIDVVVAEHSDCLALAHGADEPGRRYIHVAQI
jgi:hypothetical protein